MECISDGVEVPVYGDGMQVREWIHTDDNAELIEALMTSKTAVNQVYNIGSGLHYTNKEVLGIVGGLVGKDVKFKEVSDRLGHDRRYSLDCNKLDLFYGDWTPQCLEGFLKDEVSELLTR